MTDSERKKIEQERIDRCNNCKYYICLQEVCRDGGVLCNCRKFMSPIEPKLLISCKYFKERKHK